MVEGAGIGTETETQHEAGKWRESVNTESNDHVTEKNEAETNRIEK